MFCDHGKMGLKKECYLKLAHRISNVIHVSLGSLRILYCLIMIDLHHHQGTVSSVARPLEKIGAFDMPI